MPAEGELGWAAGIIDGEGHIGVHWQKPNPKRRELNGRERLVVQVGNTYFAIPEKLKELLGGSVHYRQTNRDTPYALWTVSQDGAKEVLTTLLPYLVAKRRLAEECIAQREQMIDRRFRRAG